MGSTHFVNHENANMKQRDISTHVPQIRPHIQRRDLNLFFMISRRPLLQLSREEISLYDNIDGRRTVAELEGIYPGASEPLFRWREAAIIELIPPVVSPPAPHLVVIEPHMDDAVLSAGGRLLNRRGRCRITILSVVKWSNFTSYLFSRPEFSNVPEVTNLRLREAALVARILGAEHRCLTWEDAPLRFCPPDRWSSATLARFKKAPEDFVRMAPNPEEVALLARELSRELGMLAPDELWIPMGLGEHLDHRTTRSACLLMLADAHRQFSTVPVQMYEELPYATEPGQAEQIARALAGCGTRLLRATEDVSEMLNDKVRLSSIYASQFKVSYIEPIIRRFAGREGGASGRFTEVYYRVEGERSLPAESHLARDWSGLAVLDTKLRSLLLKKGECRRLTIMALPPGQLGRWKTDSDSLVAAFPSADLRVYAPPEAAWQPEDGGNVKIKIELVHGGWLGWISVVLRELFRFGNPTVVMWRGAYSATPPMRPLKKLINMFIKSLLPFRQVLFTRRFSDLCHVLNEQTQRLSLEPPNERRANFTE